LKAGFCSKLAPATLSIHRRQWRGRKGVPLEARRLGRGRLLDPQAQGMEQSQSRARCARSRAAPFKHSVLLSRLTACFAQHDKPVLKEGLQARSVLCMA